MIWQQAELARQAIKTVEKQVTFIKETLFRESFLKQQECSRNPASRQLQGQQPLEGAVCSSQCCTEHVPAEPSASSTLCKKAAPADGREAQQAFASLASPPPANKPRSLEGISPAGQRNETREHGLIAKVLCWCNLRCSVVLASLLELFSILCSTVLPFFSGAPPGLLTHPYLSQLPSRATAAAQLRTLQLQLVWSNSDPHRSHNTTYIQAPTRTLGNGAHRGWRPSQCHWRDRGRCQERPELRLVAMIPGGQEGPGLCQEHRAMTVLVLALPRLRLQGWVQLGPLSSGRALRGWRVSRNGAGKGMQPQERLRELGRGSGGEKEAQGGPLALHSA
nr:uncharacterized protein LOC113460347 [Zonotrichia albicollis]